MQPSPIARAILVALFFSAFSGAAHAQAPADPFAQLRTVLKRGDVVRVTDRRGQSVIGSVTELSPSLLELRVNGRFRTLLESDILAIHHRQFDSARNGAIWGGAIGAGLGVLGTVAAVRKNEEARLLIPGLGVLAGVTGGAIGAIPILTPDRKGLSASIGLF
jgi:hypothetical protein